MLPLPLHKMSRFNKTVLFIANFPVLIFLPGYDKIENGANPAIAIFSVQIRQLKDFSVLQTNVKLDFYFRDKV